ncbi:DUF4272 domain-containing protein [Luteimonas sp. MJ246]|uniref:DUF4272 domain-containing protein n=1 Tax=Luteimonas sp. MJ174 TaxID=3129237 RepID=UPI0031B9E46C
MLRRALALASVVARAGLEARAGEAEAGAMHRRMRDWLRATGLDAALEPAEAELVNAPLGSLPEPAVVDASWRAEGIYVLAWALDRHPPLAHDRMVDPDDIAWALGFLDDAAPALLQDAVLRSERGIDTFLARQLALHWRLREYALRPGPMDFAAVVANGGWARLDIDATDLVDDDLAIDGVRIDRADAAQLARCTSIAGERHRAANWLAGADPVYSSVENIT